MSPTEPTFHTPPPPLPRCLFNGISLKRSFAVCSPYCVKKTPHRQNQNDKFIGESRSCVCRPSLTHQEQYLSPNFRMRNFPNETLFQYCKAVSRLVFLRPHQLFCQVSIFSLFPIRRAVLESCILLLLFFLLIMASLNPQAGETHSLAIGRNKEELRCIYS